MGKRSRQKSRQRERAERAGWERVVDALAALRRGDGGYGDTLVRLAGEGPRGASALEAAMHEAATTARARNWEPAEVARQVERRYGPAHAGFAAEVLAGGAFGDRLAGLEALDRAIRVLDLLLALPPIAKLGAPVRPRSAAAARVLEKVRALLAKAESTTFPEEAEALSAKAQELMARHAIDDAMVVTADGAGDVPGGLRLPVDDPYARAKSTLLSQVASANRCRSVWSPGLGFSTVFGFDGDLRFVDVLYTSLLVQATTAMVAAGSQVDGYGRSRTRSYRQSFLVAYATRIGERLRAADAAARAEAAEEYGAALLPVLADRSTAVDAACDAAFPGAIRRSISVTNAAGWAAGAAAAELASLSGRAEVPAHG
jgi:hypothetical protein